VERFYRQWTITDNHSNKKVIKDKILIIRENFVNDQKNHWISIKYKLKETILIAIG